MIKRRDFCLRLSRLSWAWAVAIGLCRYEARADPDMGPSAALDDRAFLAPSPVPAEVPPPAYIQQISRWLSRIIHHPDHQLALRDIANKTHDNADAFAHEFLATEDLPTHDTDRALRKSVLGFAENSVRHLSLFEKWQQGLRFSWDWGSEDTTPQSSTTLQSASQPLRYGLVLKDVQPSEESYLTAATHMDDYHHWDHAPKARLTWTIGPITEQSSKHPFQAQIASEVEPKPRANSLAEAVSLGTWQMNFLQPKFRGVLKSNGPMNQVLTGKVPGQVIALEQIHQVYALELHMTPSLEPGTMSHLFTIPVTDHLLYQERLNQQNETTERCMKHRFGRDKRFASQMTFFPLENRWSGDLSYRHTGVEWTITGDLPGVNGPRHFLTPEQARYELRLIIQH